MTFKVGDRIRCIDISGGGSGKFLKAGRIYEIENVTLDMVRVAGESGSHYLKRFEKLGTPAPTTISVSQQQEYDLLAEIGNAAIPS